MDKDKALRLALEALKTIDDAMPFPVAKLAIKECTAALEAEDEPWEQFYPDMGKPQFTPPQRTWVSLTEDEAIELLPEGDWEIESTLDFARAIETKLRSKNT
jgi:hypothetical protein